MAFSIKKEGNVFRLKTDLQTSLENEVQDFLDFVKTGNVNNLLIVFTEKGETEGNLSVIGDSIPLVNWLLDCAKTDLQRVFNAEGDTQCEVL